MMTYRASPDDTPRLKEAGEPSLAAGTSALEVTLLRKSYGSVVAVDDVSFSVAEGEIFGIPGPNGAGGNRHRRMCHRAPRTGHQDHRPARPGPRADQDKVHEIVGVQLQDSAFPAKLRVGEILDVHCSFYRSPELFKDLNTGAASHED